MVSITLSVPLEVKEKMNQHSEINWSGFIRKCILEKTEEITQKEQLLALLEKEKELSKWALELGKKAKQGRYEKLKRKGLV